MPQRTNDFQQLVALIQNALAPQGAKVTESAMVQVAGLTTVREVDILLEGGFGPFVVKVAIEAKDESRKLSLETFDSLLAKYRGECRVRVDKFVIVSRRGFTKGVIEKARLSDVELLTLDEAKEKKWSDLKPQTIHLKFNPHICTISIKPDHRGVSEADLKSKGVVTCTCCEKQHGTLRSFAEKQVFQVIFPRRPDLVRRLEDAVHNAPNGQATLNLNWKCQNRKVLVNGKQFPMDEISIGVHAISAKAPLTLKEFEIASSKGTKRKLQYMEALVGGKQLRFVLPDGLQSKRISVRMDSPPSVNANRPKQKVGRNSPCPCNSGKKFKQCCGGAARPETP